MSTEYSLRISDVTKQLHVSPATVEGWIESAELLAINVRGSKHSKPAWRICPDDLQAFIESRSNKPSPALFSARTKKTSQKITQYV